MGHHLAKAALLVGGLGGCSLIYNESRLPDPLDAPPDTPTVSPCELTVTDVNPHMLLEGQGDGGSRPAVLVVTGTNIVSGATVSIKEHPGERAALVTADNTKVEVATFGARLAVPVKLTVDTNIGPSQQVKSIRLDVTVTQPCPSGGTVSATLPGDVVLLLQGLDELMGSPSLATAAPNLYSRVNVVTITAKDNQKPLVVRATSSIEITDLATVNGSGQTAGPGGNPGGNGGVGLLNAPGLPGGGPGGGQPNGGGGGFGTAGSAGAGAPGSVTGLASLATLGPPNRSSGGAGNQGSVAIEGGKGGGGGGSIEISAGGTLTFKSITAIGGGGTTGFGSVGGGGSGGAVVLRSGATVVVTGPGVNATGGAGGGMGANAGGAGGVGRVRVDSPKKTETVASMPAVGYRGPMFAPDTPLIVRSPTPTLTVVGQASTSFKYNIENEKGTETRGPVEASIPGSPPDSGDLAVTFTESLFPGFNKVCLFAADASGTEDEGKNCITIAFLETF